MHEDVIIPLAGMLMGTVITVAILFTVVRYLGQRRGSAISSASAEEIVRRLERIEQLAEGTSVEVERLAESNRFVAKLLSDKSKISG